MFNPTFNIIVFQLNNKILLDILNIMGACGGKSIDKKP